MNKALRLLATIIGINAVTASLACSYTEYQPIEYYTSYIPSADPAKAETMVSLWQRTLLPDIDAKEIMSLIYDEGYSLDALRRLEVSPKLKKHLSANGNELLEYVCMMRLVNETREKMSTPWYYCYPGDALTDSLNALADECISRLDSKYGDRYAVLAARALNTLKRYPELDSIAISHKFTDKEMEARFRPEYAGYLYRLGRYDEAADIYTESGDLVSLEWCLKNMGLYQNALSALSRLADYESNYDIVARGLSSFVQGLEIKVYDAMRFSTNLSPTTLTDLGSLIETAHARSLVTDKYQPLWLYAEAMAHLINHNDFARADSVLSHVDMQKVDLELGKSIRTLRFITQSMQRPYDSAYLPWVAAEAEWLIQESDNLRYFGRFTESWMSLGDVPGIMCGRRHHYSVLYFSDMLHKAADIAIVPRMLCNGDTVAALQLLDVVDFANLSNKEIREYDNHGNTATCFALECGADNVTKALEKALRPTSSIDSLWLRHGSICNLDRWCDLAGTALLAEGKYKEAIKYLERVAPAYARSRNIDGQISTRNPFAAEFRTNSKCRDQSTRMIIPGYYKLWFARKMSKLEDQMHNENLSADQRATAMLSYGIGMANSVYPCWSLTMYGLGYGISSPWEFPSDIACKADNRDLAHYFNSDYYFEQFFTLGFNPTGRSERRLNAMRQQGCHYINDALSQIQNRETIAAYLKATCRYKTIKRHYADTAVGKEMRSKCDTWDMY